MNGCWMNWSIVVRRRTRKATFYLAIAAITSMASFGALGAQVAQAKPEPTSATTFSDEVGVSRMTNGYRIINNSNHTMELKGVPVQRNPNELGPRRPWETDRQFSGDRPIKRCWFDLRIETRCTTYGEGWELAPPREIKAGKTGVIEIPVYVHAGWSYDDSVFTYRLAGQEISFHLDVQYRWIAGTRHLRVDWSSCAPSNLCQIRPGDYTTGKGTQTKFTVG